MLVGKQASLADWRFQKEQREFAVIVNRLRALKWQREALQDEAKAMTLRQRKLNYALRPEVKARQNELARKRRKRVRLALLRAVQTCVACGVEWSLVPWLRRVYIRDFCTESCRQRYRYRTKAAREGGEP
jgi:hypothetical protein